ncbi:MAG: hybrid sensor histidine kinase/response regulator [Alphaproteobacteria bacterium]|nr:MAG: hybrid sensor histidine kinase/response regulator [Alphaproteobacteria bacterium]
MDPDLRKAKFFGLLTALFKDNESAAGNVMESFMEKPGFEDGHFDKLVRLAKAAFEEIQFDQDAQDDASMAFEMVRQSAIEASARKAQKQASKAGKEAAGPAVGNAGVEKRSSQSIRVSVDLLEDLMNMVSELVLTRNQLLQMVREREDSEFSVPIQRLSQTTTELQEGVMKTRMQPIGNAWAKLPRIVRDLSHELDKKINLEMHGADTELDRQVLELIKDPLTHMVRNSADHGIESPAERVAMGKPETGTIHLDALHEGGHIIIEIADDGRGIAVNKIRKKILEKGLATEAELDEMSENQIQKFIFHPGFSTAAEVTSVSGRGVGMDVVRNNIEKIGGTIDMVSTEGRGTTFKIKIPLTLAIVSALIVEATGERFAIPQISVLELVRAGANSDSKIERIKDTPVLRLRNRLLPLVYLNEILGFRSHQEMMEKEGHRDDFIVVTQVGAFTFGIVVDQVFDTEEIVVKPVAPILKHLSLYSGNTILGDGSVIMILDPNGIANVANAAVSEEEDQAELAEANASRAVRENVETFLLFRAGEESQKAVPLSLVARLEDIEVSRIESSDDRLVVQYRGSLMPIILADGSQGLRQEGRQPVLVFADGEYTMGLAVDEILDIVEDELDIKLGSERPGIVGSTVISGKATEIIDVSWYLGQAFGDWLRSRDLNDDISPKRGTRVLLVDDSSFFRNMLRPLLTAAGYDLLCVDNAQKALELREEGEDFDLIISDIDMPGMDGFEFAQIVKSGGRWKETPLVALSSFASERHLERGRQVGFNDYIAKFDRKALLASLSQQLNLQGDAA